MFDLVESVHPVFNAALAWLLTLLDHHVESAIELRYSYWTSWSCVIGGLPCMGSIQIFSDVPLASSKVTYSFSIFFTFPIVIHYLSIAYLVVAKSVVIDLLDHVEPCADRLFRCH